MVASYDVIIVGGGPAGCATALSLKKSAPDASFLLVDNANPSHFRIGESLPAEAKQVLNYLSPDVSKSLSHDSTEGVHLTCSGNASVWSSPQLQETFSIMNPYGSGLHLNRAVFDESMRAGVRVACDESAGRCAFVHGKFMSSEKLGSGWELKIQSPQSGEQSYRSKWIVDASGRPATVAHKIGAHTIKNDGLLAFYTVFSTTDTDHDCRTLIEATDLGWWYTSQLANQTRVVVFHTDDSDPTAKVVRKLDGFLNLLQSSTTHIAEIIEKLDYRPLSGPGSNYPRCTAAGSSHLSEFVNEEDHWCAVGDAAMAFDPLSSQGMITALKTACSMGAMLAEQIRNPADHKARLSVEKLRSQFERIRTEYEGKKKHYYTQSIFDSSPFWTRRRM